MHFSRRMLARSLFAFALLLLIHGSARAQEPAQCASDITPCGVSADDFLLTSEYRQNFTQNTPGIPGAAELQDFFGHTLASGDFNGDKINDLAIGVPLDDSDAADSGAVHVLYGSRDRVQTTPEFYLTPMEGTDSLMGWALAAGDFHGDGYDVLAVGLPGFRVTLGGTTYGSAGEVRLYYLDKDQPPYFLRFVQGAATEGPDSGTEAGDHFGFALAVGDFDGDGYQDLAVGAPLKDIGGVTDAGAVTVFYGHKGDLSRDHPRTFFSLADDNIPGTPQTDGDFGIKIVAGDFDNDGFDDIAISAPGDRLGIDVEDAGAVYILYGSEAGITDTRAEIFSQESDGILSTGERGDRFGDALVAADFNGDGYDDLAVGAPNEDEGTQYIDTGVVHVLYGSSTGLTDVGANYFSQSQDGFPELREYADRFGYALEAGDFNGDGIADLVIGTPYKDRTFQNAGVIFLVPGSEQGLIGSEARVYAQYSLTNNLSAEGDLFGYALATGDYNSDGFDDLAVSAPGEMVDGAIRAGIVHVVYATVQSTNLPWIER